MTLRLTTMGSVVGGHRTRFTGPLSIVLTGLSAQPHGSTTTKCHPKYA